MICTGGNPRDECKQEVRNLNRMDPGALLIGIFPSLVPLGPDAPLTLKAVPTLPVTREVVNERLELFLCHVRCGLQR
jgi:hypothetical protein